MDTNVYEELFNTGFSQLNELQKPVFYECIEKQSGGLSMVIGAGKTITALVTGLCLCMPHKSPMLVVMSKTLIPNWEIEIKKFFNDTLKYKIINQDNVGKFKVTDKYQLYLTTVDCLSIQYRDYHISAEFIEQRFMNIKGGLYINHYRVPKNPYLNHVRCGGLFYSIKCGCVIIDEVQIYTNITTFRCQSLGALCARYRWLLSGTMFDEPKDERLLGFMIILNVKDQPRNL